MEAFELLLPGGEASGIFACERCRDTSRGHRAREYAESCCTCARCGRPFDAAERKYRHGHMHDACSAAYRRERDAEREAKAEKVEAWDGWVYSEGGGGQDGYFRSLDEFVDHCESEGIRPEFVWTADEVAFPGLDVGDILDDLAEAMNYEDAGDHIVGTEALKAAVDAFNAANAKSVSYLWNDRRMVRVPWPEEEPAHAPQ